MKYITAFILICSIFGCESTYAINQKSQNIQACLDLLLLHQRKNYKDLETCKIILVKDAYTTDLTNLHYAKNRLWLKSVKLPDRKFYYRLGQHTNNAYTRIKYVVVDKNTINVDWELLNGNQVIKFNLVKVGNVWQPKITEMTLY